MNGYDDDLASNMNPYEYDTTLDCRDNNGGIGIGQLNGYLHRNGRGYYVFFLLNNFFLHISYVDQPHSLS